jgi:hypothetical protein
VQQVEHSRDGARIKSATYAILSGDASSAEELRRIAVAGYAHANAVARFAHKSMPAHGFKLRHAGSITTVLLRLLERKAQGAGLLSTTQHYENLAKAEGRIIEGAMPPSSYDESSYGQWFSWDSGRAKHFKEAAESEGFDARATTVRSRCANALHAAPCIVCTTATLVVHALLMFESEWSQVHTDDWQVHSTNYSDVFGAVVDGVEHERGHERVDLRAVANCFHTNLLFLVYEPVMVDGHHVHDKVRACVTKCVKVRLSPCARHVCSAAWHTPVPCEEGAAQAR